MTENILCEVSKITYHYIVEHTLRVAVFISHYL
jgi:hypothetical protein